MAKKGTDSLKSERKKGIDVLILAAGEGTRMRPLTSNIPKPLLPIAGRPFLEHTVIALRDLGLENIHILIGWKDKKVLEYFGDGSEFGVRINYLEQAERLGTAHAVSIARDRLKSDFLCINGDVVVTPELVKGLLSAFSRTNSNVMTISKVANPAGYGIVQIDEDNRVKNIIEKPERFAGDLANAGTYAFKQEIFDAIEKTPKSKRGEYEITDSIQMLAAKGTIYAYQTDWWLDVTNPWDLLAANEILMKNLKGNVKGEIEKNTTLKGSVTVGKGTVIKSGAYIVGPVIIGENSEIGPNCLIRPSTYIGDRCKVGNACEVKNCIIMNESHVPHINYVGDSIIGERCNLGAGTKIANLRFDDKNVLVIQKGKKVDSGRRKLGAIIGDDVQTGINSSINAGTIIGEKTIIGPGAFVNGNIAPKSRIY